jgi:sulfotransferase
MMNLLGQNPNHFVTPTSGLIHLVQAVMTTWPDCQEFNSQGLEQVRPAVLSAARGLLSGFFQEPLQEEKICFDKSRGWIRHIDTLEEILGRRVLIITMVRDVRGILASFEKMFRTSHSPAGAAADPSAASCADTVSDRLHGALDAEHVVGRSIERLRWAMEHFPDRLLIVPYDAFTRDPAATMTTLHHQLHLPAYEYRTDKVRQITHEAETYYGVDLHQIAEKIAAPQESDWEKMLPTAIAERIGDEYQDINSLAAGEVATGARISA